MRLKLSKKDAVKIPELIKDKELICGIDEVGRGPLAGPVVSCAAIFPKDHVLEGIKDSKKLTDKKRRLLLETLTEDAIAIGYGVVDNQMIDDINIKQATLLSMNLAILDLKDKQGNKVIPDVVLVDAEVIDTDLDQISVVGGDDTVYQISAASILAKIYRDDMMIEYAKKYPDYHFESHKGYGTKKHYQALDEVGPCPIHRLSFLKKYYQYKIDNEM